MKKVILITLTLLLITLAACSSNDISYLTYTNERYGFSVDYPDNFSKGDPPTNGDGIKITSQEEDAIIIASGRNNIFSKDKNAIYNDELKNIEGEIISKEIKGDKYTISWENNDKLYYTQRYVGSGSIMGFTMSYPKERSEFYKPIKEHVSSTFKTGVLDKAH